MALWIGARCHQCGPVELTPADFTLMVETVDPDGGYLFEGFYSFYCTGCERVAAFEANTVTVELLVTAGVRVTAMPLELTEPHTGPAIGYDDLLDLHLALGSVPA